MAALIKNVEDAARLAMGDPEHHDPLPPAPYYGPFGYFRLAILIFALFVGFLAIFNLM